MDNKLYYLENILFKIDTTFEVGKMKKENYQNDYIQYLEFSIVKLTENKKWLI